MSIRLRLTLWYSIILACTLAVFGVSFYLLLSTVTMNQYKQSLAEQADQIQQRIAFQYSLSLRGFDLNIQLDKTDQFLTREVYLQVINLTNLNDIQRSKKAEEDNVYIPVNGKKVLEAAHNNQSYFNENVQIAGHSFLVYHQPVVYRGQVVGILQAATYTGELLNDYKTLFVPAAMITVLIASLFGWFLASKALQPIDQVIASTKQIEKGSDLERRIPYEGPNDEIGRLTDTINHMLSRIQSTYNELEELYKGQRRFVSDASHELRTPLTTIRGNIDLLEKMWKQQEQGWEEEQQEMAQEAMRDIASEAERMSRLVNDLLSLARADAGYEMQKEVVSLQPLLQEVSRNAQMLPKHAEWIVGNLDPSVNVTVHGNADYLKQMLLIFIENAFKYTEQGYVRIDAMYVEEQAGIRITDTGIGMKQEEIPEIFKRFYRADLSRGKTAGTGLGLSIAQWIIDQHQGSIEVITKVEKGTSFVIWLPAEKAGDSPQAIETS